MHLISTSKPHPTHPMPPPSILHMELENKTLESENARHLWAAVMERAILDLQDHSTQDDAIAWIVSNRHSIGSFFWVCHQLDLDPNSVKRALLGHKFQRTTINHHPMQHALPMAS